MTTSNSALNVLDNESILPNPDQVCQVPKATQTYSPTFFLTAKHQATIHQKRGLLNDWTRATFRSVTKEEATFELGYEAKSGGLLFCGQTLQKQLRPDRPWKKEEDKKAPKYRTPLTDHGCDALLPTSPYTPDYWDKINLEKSCYQVNGHPCLVITEGDFKAIAGCSNDIPTIGLIGVEMGLTGKKDDVQGKRYLIPTLEKYARDGFGFIIAFDADAAINPQIDWAQRKLGHQFLKFNVPVYIATGNWEMGIEGETKGMDDLIQKKGIEVFRKALSAATDFKSWEARILDGDDSKAKSKLPSSDAMARQIAEDYRDKLAFNNEVLCWYRYEAESSGVWAPETDEYVESIIYQIIKSKGLVNIPPSYIGATVRFLRHELIERKWKSRADLLPFHNGALEIATGKLHPHSPGYKFTWSLPRPHSVVATDWGVISNWLDVVTAGNQHIKNILIAYGAATLKGRADIQKFLHPIGIGGSGKGTYCGLLIALIGLENTHSSTLDDWCSNRFEAAQAYGKRLLVFPDEDKGTRSLGKFKQLTGGDWLRAEEKGKKPFKFKFEGMVVVASNFPIFGADNSSGMSRRTIAVPFNAIIGRNERRNLGNDFVPELAAFTNYLLSLDDAWVENILRGVMEVPEVGAQFWESKIREDSIAGFLNDKLILDPLGQVSIGDSPNAEGSLYQAYHQYCADQGHRPQAVKNFSPNLIECAGVILGWQVEKVHTKVGKIIKGIRLRTKADEHLPTYDYELRLRCEKPGDGYGDGLVTDTVTGQNPELELITALVTDSSYSQVEKRIDVEDESRCDENSSTEVSTNPSPESKPLPIESSDPSPQPSPQPSLHPSPISPSTPAKVEASKQHKEFVKGDRVVIVEVDSLHEGQHGEVLYPEYGSQEIDYMVKLDKESHGIQLVKVTVPHDSKLTYLMKL